MQEALLAFVEDRQLLFVLDNCEHLLQACAELAKELLRAGPQVKILATSREPLHVVGETTYQVPPLPVPNPRLRIAHTALTHCESVRLFVDRAVAAQPAFRVTPQNATPVADICRRLDGIPLALELAAARVRTLPVETIAARLSDSFRLLTGGDRTALPRQQTLRACIDWSYDLLTEPERALLRRLAVFAGGWTLEAAEAVGGTGDAEANEVLDRLIQLVEKSLVAMEAEGRRYRLLETVRQYAHEKLVETGASEAVRERHRDYFLALAEEAAPKLIGAEQAAWLKRLEDEHENLRAGLEWSLAADARGGLRFCGALQRFWFTRGHLSEGRAWCARLLGKAASEERTVERAKALQAAGSLALYQADYPAARAGHEACLAIWRELGDPKGTAASLNNLGNIAFQQGDLASARDLHEQCLAIVRELGDRARIAVSVHNLASTAHFQGDLPAARALYQEGLALMRELGNQHGISAALINLAELAFDQCDYPAARALTRESMAIVRELGDRAGLASSLRLLGRIGYEEGDHDAARTLNQEGLVIRRELGDRRGIADSLEGLAEVVAASGSPLRSAGIWGAAERLREEVGSPLASNERLRVERRVAAARAALGDDAAFDRAWQEGRALALDQGIELALHDTVERRRTKPAA